MGGGGKGGGSSNPNLDQIINQITNAASQMQGTQTAQSVLGSQGTTAQDMTQTVTGLPSEAQRISDYQQSLDQMRTMGKSPVEALQNLGQAPGGQLYSGKMDPLAAAQYGKAIQDDMSSARNTNAELARQFGARGGDESAVLQTLQQENLNQAKLNRSPLLTAMMDISRKVEQEQRAADMQSYSANIQNALAQGQALSPLMATLNTTTQSLLAGRGSQSQSTGLTAQNQQTSQVGTQAQTQSSTQDSSTAQSQRERAAHEFYKDPTKKYHTEQLYSDGTQNMPGGRVNRGGASGGSGGGKGGSSSGGGNSAGHGGVGQSPLSNVLNQKKV